MPGGDLEFSSSGGVDPGFLDESGTPRYSYDPIIESEQSDTERGDPEVESGMIPLRMVLLGERESVPW